MWYIFLLFISILPVYILGKNIYKNDHEKEPKKLLVKLFLLGILSVVVTLILSGIINRIPLFAETDMSNLNLFTLIIYVFIGIALIEEFSKWIFVYGGTYNSGEFDHAYDAIVYSVFVSLGFACIENILYVIGSADAIQTAVMRSISAVPGHASFGIFMGYYLALAKIAEKNNNMFICKKNKMLSLLVPIILHGIYDYLLFATEFIELSFLVFIVFIVWMFNDAAKKVRQLANIKQKMDGTSILSQVPIQNSFGYNFCPICGDRVRGNYCRVCGRNHIPINNNFN